MKIHTNFSSSVVLDNRIIRMCKSVEFNLSEVKIFNTANVAPSQYGAAKYGTKA